MGVSENSPVSVNVVAWFDFTSLHSITDQTHLLASPAPSVFWVYFFIQPPVSSIGTNLYYPTTVTDSLRRRPTEIMVFLLEKTEKGKTKRKKTNGWVVVWRSMVGWCENQLNKPIHSNFSFGSFFFFSIRFKKASSWSQWNDDIIAAISHISLYIFSLFSTPFLSINQINSYTT